MDVFFKRVV